MADAVAARPPAMHDVARLARVSHQTVSRVLNGHPHVSPDTRARVEEAIATLGYRRNAAARSLVTRRSGIIGILTDRSKLYGPTSSLLAVEVAAREAGYYVSLASVADPTAAAMSAAVEHFRDQSVEAIVQIAPARQWVTAARSIPADVPMVTMSADYQVARGRHAAVALDNRAGARLMTEHLIGLGHRRIAFVAGADSSPEAVARLKSWRDVMAAAGLPADRVYHGDWSPESGHAAGRQLFADGVPSAVFAANDQMALGVLAAAAEAGLSVPGDVSVAGFDDVPDAAFFTPTLTTIRQDFDALAHGCVGLLERLLRGEPVRSIRILPELMIRQSTAPPR
ncbi:LacI family DNA-binding transcriptional regulator [Desertimonas flava]|uniref:LacI family DNA-binding transcriptional regulator n=1 Tax=Desertimonas flava TaxID=2064846 RepID=UPI0019694BD7|nr:LacI family DNA-binding transcriptional regulator [Desertimonas flava]